MDSGHSTHCPGRKKKGAKPRTDRQTKPEYTYRQNRQTEKTEKTDRQRKQTKQTERQN